MRHQRQKQDSQLWCNHLRPSYHRSYQELILLLWQNQWLRLQKDFSFCTGSLSNRKLDKKIFDIQIVPHPLSKSIGRSDQEIIVLHTDKIDSPLLDCPEWVSYVVNEILYEQSGKLKEFLDELKSGDG